MNEPIDKLWNKLVRTHDRVRNGPISDRRTLDAFRNGLLTAYAIVSGESEEKVRERLMESEADR